MMKYVLATIVAMSVLSLGLQAQDVFYRLTNISDTFSPVNCAENGGKGALVAALNPDGTLSEDWTATCLTPVK